MNTKPRLLDLFSGAGGAAKGYQRAGFYVVGIDIAEQPHYCGDEFHQADALEYAAAHGHEFDAIHASPPCQFYSLGPVWRGTHNNHAENDYIGKTEQTLNDIGIPAIIENVSGAPFTWSSVTLCGIQFGLKVIRHRIFAANFFLLGVGHVLKHPKRGEFVTCAGHGGDGSNKYSVWADAMEIDWMSKAELAQAIPPAYTEFIGRQLIRILGREIDGF